MAEANKAIVVLGAGRSGTSLLMQILTRLGMSVSEHLVSPRYHNPLGPMEDLDIASVYDRDILPSVASSRLLPFPYDEFKRSHFRGQCIAKLETIVNDYKKNNVGRIWGFKDPFTSSILPIWFKVFNQCAVVPKFILCVRNPTAVVESRETSFGDDEAIGELAWLNSTVSALIDSKCDVFVVHYENWFDEPLGLSKDLIDYTGLENVNDKELSAILKDCIKSNLNRSSGDSNTIKNRYVHNLYQQLLSIRGHKFDKDNLMTTVIATKSAMDDFKGWYSYAHKKHRELNVKITEMHALKKKLLAQEDLMKQIDKLKLKILKKNQLIEKLDNLTKQLEQFIDLCD